MIKKFKILQHPSGDIEAVKTGWSWPAFFFSFIWAMVKKMYLTGIALFLFSLMLGIIIEYLHMGPRGDAMNNILTIAISIIFGLKGNEWCEALLLRRGYEAKAVIAAPDPHSARACFLQEKKQS